MIDLTDRVMLVTGAAGGIGAATVRKLVSLGALVVAHDLREPERGERVHALAGDLREPDAARALWAQAWAWKDRIDVLVNCAGIYAAAPVESDFADWTEAWRRTLDVNLLAPAVLCREAIVAFRARGGGIIVNFASRAAWRGDDAEYQGYAASKAGIVAMTKTIARHHGREGITAFAIAPGWVHTAFNQDFFDQYGVEAAAETIPLGEVAEPEDIANTVAFLASGLAKHATGATIDINGASYVR
jgi:NAD(P)-dependent dehydrogenase (short-subunit alcohol dehydrogenase family)